MIGFLLLILSVFSQTLYFADSHNGEDSPTCGPQDDPCSSLNQVLINYPGASYNISIYGGTYPTSPFTLENDAVVVFQGLLGAYPNIVASWKTGIFITNTRASAALFRFLLITLSGDGSAFIALNGASNSVGFYSTIVKDSGDQSTSFVTLTGGSVVVSNVTFTDATFDSYFIVDQSDGGDSNITITESAFTNVTIGKYGGFLVSDGLGASNIIINSSTFDVISSEYVFIGFWAEDYKQVVNITNNKFSNINTYLPSIYIENDFQCVIYISDSTWTNSTAQFVSGAVETLGADDRSDHNITFNNLIFINCSGPDAGAVLVGFISLNVAGSNFSKNTGKYGSDLVQAVDSASQFGHTIANSFSLSKLPKAVIWNVSDDTVKDISDELPYDDRKAKPGPVPVRRMAREKISASPKFGRKPRA